MDESAYLKETKRLARQIEERRSEITTLKNWLRSLESKIQEQNLEIVRLQGKINAVLPKVGLRP